MSAPTPGPPSPQRPRFAVWALLTISAGCILALVIGISGGITYLALSGGGDSPAPTAGTSDAPSETTTQETAEPSDGPTFEVIAPTDRPEGTADELWAVLANTPMTEGTMPAIGECELPTTPAEPDAAQLQAVLDAASSCLNRIWAQTSSDRNLPWNAITVTVYTWPDAPSETACPPEEFSENAPYICNLDATIYWPVGYGLASQWSDPDDAADGFLWDLAYYYTGAVGWMHSLLAYYIALADSLDSDPDRQDEAYRRYALQSFCIASVTTMRVPEASQPSTQLHSTLINSSTWKKGTTRRSLEPTSRAHWIKQGFDSEGDLTSCNTWVAPAGQVA